MQEQANQAKVQQNCSKIPSFGSLYLSVYLLMYLILSPSGVSDCPQVTDTFWKECNGLDF